MESSINIIISIISRQTILFRCSSIVNPFCYVSKKMTTSIFDGFGSNILNILYITMDRVDDVVCLQYRTSSRIIHVLMNCAKIIRENLLE